MVIQTIGAKRIFGDSPLFLETFSGRKISLMQRSSIEEAIGKSSLGYNKF